MDRKYQYPLTPKDYYSLVTLIRKYSFEYVYQICTQIKKDIEEANIYFKKHNIDKPLKNKRILEHDHYWILRTIICENGFDETKFVLRYIRKKGRQNANSKK